VLRKGDDAGYDEEEVKHFIYESAKKSMELEASGLYKLATIKSQPTDLHLWK
jgi:hypothetical protein